MHAFRQRLCQDSDDFWGVEVSEKVCMKEEEVWLSESFRCVLCSPGAGLWGGEIVGVWWRGGGDAFSKQTQLRPVITRQDFSLKPQSTLRLEVKKIGRGRNPTLAKLPPTHRAQHVSDSDVCIILCRLFLILLLNWGHVCRYERVGLMLCL